MHFRDMRYPTLLPPRAVDWERAKCKRPTVRTCKCPLRVTREVSARVSQAGGTRDPLHHAAAFSKGRRPTGLEV